MLIEGVFAALTTPFYPDERVYYRKLEFNVARMSRSLVSGMVVLGSTGEAAMLTDDESRQVLETAAPAAAAEKVLVAGISRESVRATLELAEVAAGAGYDLALVRPPSFYGRQMDDRAVLQYYRTIADRSPLPVLLYNIPKCVPHDLTPGLVAELAQHPNIVGIKDSTGSLERIEELVAATAQAPRRTVPVTGIFQAVTGRMQQKKSAEALVAADKLATGVTVAAEPVLIPVEQRMRTKEVGFQVIVGAAGILHSALKAGATAGMLGFAACAPEACHEVYFSWKERDPELAEARQQAIAAASQRIVNEFGISAIKAACDYNGFYGGPARLPLLPLTAAERAEVESLLARIRN